MLTSCLFSLSRGPKFVQVKSLQRVLWNRKKAAVSAFLTAPETSEMALHAGNGQIASCCFRQAFLSLEAIPRLLEKKAAFGSVQ